MTTLTVLFGGVALVLVAILSLSIRWTTKGYVRLLILVLGVLFLPLGYGSMAGLLGLPKPISLEWFKNDAKKARVMGYYFVEGKSIDLWLLVEGDMEPTYYSLPWSMKDAQQLQDAFSKAREQHTGVAMDWQAFKKDGLLKQIEKAVRNAGKKLAPGKEGVLGPPTAPSQETRSGPKFYALPQHKIPDKQVPAPGLEYHRPAGQ
ncbi:MAG: hypothetical protein Q7S95_01515 [bacterium]|nr:hypothetical protein [bacterium]